MDAFYQANLFEGHLFLDSRGRLTRALGDPFNLVAEDFENGASIIHLWEPISPSQSLIEIKLSSAMIWLHYSGDVNTVSVRQETARIVREACEIIEVDRFSRQGIRTSYIFPAENPEDAIRQMRNSFVPRQWGFDELGEVQSGGINVRLGVAPLTVQASIQPVKRGRMHIQVAGAAEAPEEQREFGPPYGVLVDSDVFDERKSDSADPKPHLNHSVDFMEDRFLPIIGKLLNPDGK